MGFVAAEVASVALGDVDGDHRDEIILAGLESYTVGLEPVEYIAQVLDDAEAWSDAAGVLVLEGIGMTENTSFTNINRFTDYRFGWVGPTGPGIEQKPGDLDIPGSGGRTQRREDAVGAAPVGLGPDARRPARHRPPSRPRRPTATGSPVRC